MPRKRSEKGRTPGPLTGGYYWFPAPADGSVEWSVPTCHDLGFDPDEGHFDMWPSIIDLLATAWGRDAVRLRKVLGTHCYGLPRGRVTRPDRRSLILHGHDALVPDWLERVVERFDLDTRSARPLFDEHERMLTQDRRIVYAEFGLTADSSPSEGGEASC